MKRWIVAITVMLPTLIVIVDTSVVNVSLDHIRGSLSAGIDESTWAVTSYLASSAVIIPMTGWLSRLFGRKRYLLISIGLFTFSSFMCGSSWNLQSLVFFRALQGIGGGALQPLSQAILLETFPPEQHGMAMAVYGVGTAFGPIIGPLLGGWITDNWSWPWIFFVNVPIGFVSILMTLLFIDNPPYMERTRMKIDYWGLFFLVIGIGCLQIVLDKGQREDWFSSGFITWTTYVSISSLVLFIVAEIFAENPIVNLRTFRNLSFSMGNIVMFLLYFSLFSSIILLPIFLQTLLGYTSYLSGLALAPGSAVMIVAMPLAGKLVTKINPKAMLACGIATVAYSIYLMSRFNLLVDFTTIFWPRVWMSLGFGILFIPLTTLTLSGIKKEEMGNATGIFNFLRNLGGSFGVAIVTTLLDRRTQFHHARLIEHLTPLDKNFQLALPEVSRILQGRGLDPSVYGHSALGSIYQQLTREASMLSFNDVFHLLAIIAIVIIPLVLLMKKGEAHGHTPSME